MSINYAAVPTIRQDPALAAEWEDRLTLPDYDRFAQAGMVMTEKQGGSDLRANTTGAEPAGDGWYELTGHKWFCTHPVFDIFLTLAQAPGGITCFVAERPHPGFRLQRLKDKLGGRCLASSEVEFDHLPARILGEEGRGTAFMIEQIVWTRLDTLLGIAGMMRRAVAEAIWHARHRSAFGAPLAQQPAMRNVLADLALESEAAMAAAMRIVRAFDERRPTSRLPPPGAGGHEVLGLQARRALRGRGARVPGRQRLHRGGAAGPVLPRHPDRHRLGGLGQRDRPRRAARDGRNPEGVDAFMAECELGPRRRPALDAHLDRDARGARRRCARRPAVAARAFVEDLALALQAAVLLRTAPPAVADAFCAGRLGPTATAPSARCRAASTPRRSSLGRSRSRRPRPRSSPRPAPRSPPGGRRSPSPRRAWP